jgi:hypothetical protein
MGLDDPTVPPPPSSSCDWRAALRADLRQVGVRRPWGRALRAVGWVHLVFFLACQAVYTWGDRSVVFALSLWALELGAVLAAMRRVAGRDWIRESPGVALIVRIWVTFLILSFNLASLNHLTGWTVDWFKPVWCTLASFGFATLAWLFGARFLIWAVQMYFTGLLMVQMPRWNYAINALSWFLIFQVIGRDLERERARWLGDGASRPIPAEPAADSVNGQPAAIETIGA